MGLGEKSILEGIFFFYNTEFLKKWFLKRAKKKGRIDRDENEADSKGGKNREGATLQA